MQVELNEMLNSQMSMLNIQAFHELDQKVGAENKKQFLKEL